MVLEIDRGNYFDRERFQFFTKWTEAMCERTSWDFQKSQNLSRLHSFGSVHSWLKCEKESKRCHKNSPSFQIISHEKDSSGSQLLRHDRCKSGGKYRICGNVIEISSLEKVPSSYFYSFGIPLSTQHQIRLHQGGGQPVRDFNRWVEHRGQ